ncbi:hypothetical protein PC121_g16174 [Phytophthora cactorum]|nr:hypothetical protein PC121_g16174 [Phytophthora cactorum]
MWTSPRPYPPDQIGFIMCQSKDVLGKPDAKIEQMMRYYSAKIHEASFERDYSEEPLALENGRVWIQSRAATAKTKVAATLAGLCAHHMEAPETETLLLHPACLVGVYGGDEVMNGLKSQLESKEDVDKLLPS